jgi:ribonuclease HI
MTSYHFAHTDGSARGNPGPGGWAVLMDGRDLTSGNFKLHVTNNQMELYAVYMAMDLCPYDCDFTIFTDSSLVIGYYCKQWKINKLHKEIVGATFNLLLVKHVIWHFEWVKGHDNNPFNDKVDKAAHGQSKIAQNAMLSTSKG